MVGTTTVRGLLVDRFHRGAIVMVGSKMFAIPEEAIRVVEAIQGGAPLTSAEESIAESLVERGVLVKGARQ